MSHFRLLRFTSVFLVAGCGPEESFQEIAIVAPHGMEDQASKICPQNDEGEVFCDPEWQEDLRIEQKCSGSQNPVVFSCEPEKSIEGAWVYTLPLEPGKPPCWSFKNLPDGHVLKTEEKGSMKTTSKLCTDLDEGFDASKLLYLLPEST